MNCDELITDDLDRKSRQSGNVISVFIAICLGICIFSGSTFLTYLVILMAIISVTKVEQLIPSHLVILALPVLFDTGLLIGIEKVYSIIIFIGLIIRLYEQNKFKIRIEYWGLVLLFFVCILISGFHSEFKEPWGTIQLWIMNIASFLLYSQLVLSKNNAIKLLYNFSYTFLIIIIFGFIKVLSTGALFTGRITLGDQLNENYFAMAFSQFSIGLYACGLLLKRSGLKRISYFAFVFGTFLVLFSGSRSSMFGLVCSAFLTYFLYTDGLENKNLKKFVFCIFAIIVLLVLYYVVQSNVMLSDRFSIASLTSKSGSGAIRGASLLLEIQRIIPDHLLFGVGPSALSEMDALAQYGNLVFSSHNLIFSMLTQIGLIGSILFALLLIKVLRRLFNGIKANKYILLPLSMILAILINGVGEQVFCERIFWFDLSLSVVLINSTYCFGVNSSGKSS